MYKVYVVTVMFTSQESEIIFIWNCVCAYCWNSLVNILN